MAPHPKLWFGGESGRQQNQMFGPDPVDVTNVLPFRVVYSVPPMDVIRAYVVLPDPTRA